MEEETSACKVFDELVRPSGLLVIVLPTKYVTLYFYIIILFVYSYTYILYLLN